MPLVALTGGIASGKSTVARRLAEHGAIVVDADQIVRDVQQPGSPVLSAIAAEFGAGMIRPDGSLDRAALGGAVFGDAAAVTRLNAIVHPAVREESARRFAEAFAADPDAVVVYDVPLLVEARVDDPWDLIIVAHAPAEMRQQRLIELRGMTDADAAARIASQVPDEARLAIADAVIDTTGSLADTERQIDALWEVCARASRLAPADASTGDSGACRSGRQRHTLRPPQWRCAMSILSKFRRHGSPDDALSDEERIARYVYLLNTLPASVIESAHTKAFQDVPPEQRTEMFERLRPFMSEAERDAASDDPTVLARVLRRAEEHRAARAGSGTGAAAAGGTVAGEAVDPRDAVDPRGLLQDTGVMTLVAYQFLLSSAVSSYFIHGAGSLDLANQPPWVGETYDPAAAAGTDPDGGGGDVGGGGIDGAGFNGGEFGGGFDGSGFGGGGFNGAGG